MPAEGVKKMGSLGPQEIVLILIAGLLLFGAKRLPELGKSLGQGMREFRRSLSGAADDTDKEENAKKTSDQAG
jgi:sec-independent protein translocase protein TatA